MARSAAKHLTKQTTKQVSQGKYFSPIFFSYSYSYIYNILLYIYYILLIYNVFS
jgi:uncharacterized membrane protein